LSAPVHCPEQPLVQSTDEKPQGPLTLRVYPSALPGKDCGGSLYLDDGTSYAFKKGDSCASALLAIPQRRA